MEHELEDNRRPLASRQTGWAQRTTTLLAKTGITPNQISIGSMIAAALAGTAFALSAISGDIASIGLLIVAAVFCQLRLLCNLFDGMVALEAGQKAPDGPAWNEFPDRFADIFIFAGLGVGAGLPALGWAAACLAVLTAYTRELGAGLGQPHDFGGPMAKQHRMAAVTIASVLTALWAGWSLTSGSSGDDKSFQLLLQICLWIVVAGSLITAILRLARLVKKLNTA